MRKSMFPLDQKVADDQNHDRLHVDKKRRDPRSKIGRDERVNQLPQLRHDPECQPVPEEELPDEVGQIEPILRAVESLSLPGREDDLKRVRNDRKRDQRKTRDE